MTVRSFADGVMPAATPRPACVMSPVASFAFGFVVTAFAIAVATGAVLAARKRLA